MAEDNEKAALLEELARLRAKVSRLASPLPKKRRKKSPMVVVTCRVPAAIRDALQHIASKTPRYTASDVIVNFLEHGVLQWWQEGAQKPATLREQVRALGLDWDQLADEAAWAEAKASAELAGAKP